MMGKLTVICCFSVSYASAFQSLAFYYFAYLWFLSLLFGACIKVCFVFVYVLVRVVHFLFWHFSIRIFPIGRLLHVLCFFPDDLWWCHEKQSKTINYRKHWRKRTSYDSRISQSSACSTLREAWHGNECQCDWSFLIDKTLWVPYMMVDVCSSLIGARHPVLWRFFSQRRIPVILCGVHLISNWMPCSHTHKKT